MASSGAPAATISDQRLPNSTCVCLESLGLMTMLACKATCRACDGTIADGDAHERASWQIDSIIKPSYAPRIYRAKDVTGSVSYAV
jgi:hypothetical protein